MSSMRYKKILEPIAELLMRKNIDYGNSYDKLREEYGPTGFYIRIADKLSRIKQLDANPSHVKDEAIEDTIRDIIGCLLYTSDAADEEDSVDLGGRRIIKKKKKK